MIYITNRENFQAALNFEKPDRLPAIEWATWWDKTVGAWRAINPRCPSAQQELFSYFGLDSHYQFWVSPRGARCPEAKYHGGPVIGNTREYHDIKKHLYPDEHLRDLEKRLKELKPLHDAGEIAVWYSVDGFFWFPRTLLGIEAHLYSFYDEPELLHEMNTDLCAFYRRTLETVYGVLTPVFMTFAEDMSYNLGPMLSKEQYDEFMKPYYLKLVPIIKSTGTKVFIDTDGQVEPLIPWFLECGIEGCLPLERMAGVDVARIREKYPRWLMIGGFDKTVMHKGEAAMRTEFDRLLPVVRSGGFIPGVDHQTPPDVSEENYRIYVRLLKEYARSGRSPDGEVRQR